MASKKNLGVDFDPKWVESPGFISPGEVQCCLDDISMITVEGPERIGWLLQAIKCIDLTSLPDDDLSTNVQQLCGRALQPLPEELLKAIHFGDKDLHTAAVCVYPARAKECKEALSSAAPHIAVASVAGGFPSGQGSIESKKSEIKAAIENGASEVDVVINRNFALCEDWEALYNEVKEMKKSCGDDVRMKTILTTGELGSLSTVCKTSKVCLMAGSDFIKTSTGKEKVNATLPVGLIMGRAIRAYEEKTGFQVGLKPAGGIRTTKQVISWQMLMKKTLGKPWLFSDLFRIGTSGLLDDIQEEIYNYVNGTSAPTYSFPCV